VASTPQEYAAMNDELIVIFDVVKRLSAARIPYMLTGSVAMNYYAVPRMTRDIDFVIEFSESKLMKLEELFNANYYISPEAVKDALKYGTPFNLIHEESQIKVDCIIRKQSEYRLLEFSRRKTITLEDKDIFIVSKEDLMLSKLVWAKDSHSQRQLDDVRNLAQTGYDREYLFPWSRSLGVSALFKECE